MRFKGLRNERDQAFDLGSVSRGCDECEEKARVVESSSSRGRN